MTAFRAFSKCPKCRVGGFTAKDGFDRPVFTCTRCDHRWSSGKDGSPYLDGAQNRLGYVMNKYGVRA